MTREEADTYQFQATNVVLNEVASILEDIKGAVVVGGTVPFLLIPQDKEQHVGTVDIDVVLDPRSLAGSDEQTLHDMLELRLFQRDTIRPFRYYRNVVVDEKPREVLVEFLIGGLSTPSGLFRIEREDVYASVIKGMEIALDGPVVVDLPTTKCPIKVASMPSFLVMKANALEARQSSRKSKDAYDIVYCLRNISGGVEAIATEIISRLPNALLEHGISLLANQFFREDSTGPTAYSVSATSDREARLMRREAYERVNDLLERIQKH